MGYKEAKAYTAVPSCTLYGHGRCGYVMLHIWSQTEAGGCHDARQLPGWMDAASTNPCVCVDGVFRVCNRLCLNVLRCAFEGGCVTFLCLRSLERLALK